MSSEEPEIHRIEEKRFHRYQKIPERKQGFVGRVFDRIKGGISLFGEVQESGVDLQGRIYDLHRTATGLVEQLQEVKNQWKKKIDNELYELIEGVIDPMIRDVSRLKGQMRKQGTVTEQARAFKEFSEWIDKAKAWVKLYSTADDRKAIEQAVTDHTIKDVFAQASRDFQIIIDYQEHILHSLELDRETERRARYQITEQLCGDLAELCALKRRPSEEITLSSLSEWKRKIDRKRQRIFDAALHSIDEVADEWIPEEASFEDHEHILDVFSQIGFLEDALPKLIEEIETCDLSSDQVSNRLMSELNSLESEAHKLNLDLRLSIDCIERLQSIMNDIFNAKILMMH